MVPPAEIVLAARAALAGLLGAAAVMKAVDRDATRSAARSLGVPAFLTRAVATTLPVVEGGVAIALLVPRLARPAAVLAGILLTAFTVVLLANLARGHRPSCNCFGAVGDEPISWWSIGRNALLTVLAVVALSEVDDAAIAIPALAAVAVAQSFVMRHLLVRSSGAVRGQAEVQGGVRRAAPPFELTRLSGGLASLDDLLHGGLPVVLVFTDPHCGPCRALMPSLADWQQNLADRLAIVVITAGPERAAREEVAAAGLDDALLDEDLVVADAFGYEGTPAAVAIGSDGYVTAPSVSGEEAIRRLIADAALTAPARRGAAHSIPVAAAVGRAVGEPAPDVVVEDPDGRTTSLDTFSGRLAVVVFWDPSCRFCRDLASDVRAWEATAPSSLGVLILSAGGADAVREEGFRSFVGLDPRGIHKLAFGAPGTPAAVLVDAEGRIASPVAAGAAEVNALLARAARLADLAEQLPGGNRRP